MSTVRKSVPIIFFVILAVLALGVAVLWQLGFLGSSALDFRQSPEEAATSQLFGAIEAGDLPGARANLEAGASLSATEEEMTPLMTAASAGSSGILTELLQRGAAVNTATSAGLTPLMFALRDSDIPANAVMLLNAGADPTLTDREGRTALDYAANNGTMRRSGAYVLLEDLVGRPFDPTWPSAFTSPVPGATFSSRAPHLPGARRAYRNGYHEGFDFYDGVVSVPITYGTPVVATADGVVVRADHDYTELTPGELQDLLDDAAARPATPQGTLDKLRGRQVWLAHPGGFISRYAHLSGIPENLEVGQVIVQGQTVGFAGNSGTSEGVLGTQDDAHPHYELWRGDETYLGEGLEPDEIYPLVAQVFGERALPPFRE